MAYRGRSIFLASDFENHWWNCDQDEEILGRLDEAQVSEETCIYLFQLTMSEKVAHRLKSLISHRRHWAKWESSECVYTPHLGDVLDCALYHFTECVLSDLKFSKPNLSLGLFHSLSKAIGQSPTLQRLELREMTITREQARALSSGLARSSKESLKFLRLGSIRFKDTRAVDALARGLKCNRSLISLEMVRCQLTDKQIEQIATSLLAHPTLTELDLTGNYCRARGLHSISNFLGAEKCQLTTLKLNDQLSFQSNSLKVLEDKISAFPIKELVTYLERNMSLRHLELSRNRLQAADNIHSLLWKFPNLLSLDLMGNRITQLKDLGNLAVMDGSVSIPRLRRLELSYNCFFKNLEARHENAKWLCKLLEANPELQYCARPATRHLPKSTSVLFWHESTIFDERIQHFLDLNKAGRTLVANNSIPDSLWPIVLSRVNAMLDGPRQANALFHLLQGPIAVSR